MCPSAFKLADDIHGSFGRLARKSLHLDRLSFHAQALPGRRRRHSRAFLRHLNNSAAARKAADGLDTWIKSLSSRVLAGEGKLFDLANCPHL